MSVVDRGVPPVDVEIEEAVEPARRAPFDDRWLRRSLDVVVVSACVLFVFWQLHPGLILADNTPTGGDMGAHVWAFGFLRDHLLPSGQLSGWTQDWYAGFPAFQYYMVVPFLAMVILNAGWAGFGAVAAAVVAVAGAGVLAGVDRRRLPVVVAVTAVAGAGLEIVTDGAPGFYFGLMVTSIAAVFIALRFGRSTLTPRAAHAVAAASILVALVAVPLPYGVAFKVVAVSGVVAMPACAYLFGRLCGFAFPTPSLLAVVAVAFAFDTNFTIYGGNIASTMAGEFAFSIALALALVYLGLLARGLRTGQGRAATATVLALVGLCHLLPVFFCLAGTAVFLVVHAVDETRAERDRSAALGLGLAAFAAIVAAAVAMTLELATTGPILVVTVLFLVIAALVWNLARGSATPPEPGRHEATVSTSDDNDEEVDAIASTPVSVDTPQRFVLARTWWLISMGAISALLAAWWVLPFYAKQTYLNDMGWAKISVHTEGVGIWKWFTEDVASRLVPTAASEHVDHAATDLRVWAVLAIVGALLSIAFRHRIGTGLVALGLILAAGFVYAPQGRLWNARILPFWYLVVYLLAAVGIGEIFRSIAAVLSPREERTGRGVLWVAGPVVGLIVMVALAAQLHNLPLLGSTDAEGNYEVGVGPLQVEVTGSNIAAGWSQWNFEGYEGKDRYPEYRAIVDTMADIGETNGCGRALWEYNSELNSYGTPMALMLLPHWTDGCIGSMEGLYFEASSTTPFHFLMQSELSTAPSRAQRDMPYREFDIDAGVEHLQLMGVRYYMTYTPQATEAARAHPDLTELDSSQHWVVFQVADAPLVEALDYQPAVTTGSEIQDEWLCAELDESGRCTGIALDWFQNSDVWDVALAADGPDEWQRVDPGVAPEKRPVDPATVSNIEIDDDNVSFSVDQVGTPVLVKVSYFPNWSVSGADGPYRVAPNLMVVVPTDTDVTLTYGRTAVDWLSWLLTAAGIAVAVMAWRRGSRPLPPLRDDAIA